MSKKNLDQHGRFRGVTVGFRVSEEESREINLLVAFSGMNKQDYIISRLRNKEMRITGNPRVFIGLKKEMKKIMQELSRILQDVDLKDDHYERLKDILDMYQSTVSDTETTILKNEKDK